MTSQKLTYLAGGPDGVIHVKSSLRGIGGLEVLVKVTHSGLCGTGMSRYIYSAFTAASC